MKIGGWKKKVGKVAWRRNKIVYHRKGCMSHDIITKYMNWISLHLLQYFWVCIHEKNERKFVLILTLWHSQKVLLLHHFLVEFDFIFIIFSSSSIQLYSSISQLPFMNAKLVQSWESSEKENWVAIWEIYLLAMEHYSIDQFIDGWLDGQEAIIGYLWDYYIM